MNTSVQFANVIATLFMGCAWSREGFLNIALKMAWFVLFAFNALRFAEMSGWIVRSAP